MFSRIILPVSGKKRCARAMKALDLVEDICNGTIVLLHVIEPIAFNVSRINYEQIFQEEAEAAKNMMAPILARLELLGIPHEIRIAEGELASRIVSIAENENADLITMFTDTNSSTGSRFLGPVAERVLRLTGIPVLAARQ